MESNSRNAEKAASFIIALGESAMVIDPAGTIIDANARQAEMLGLTVEEMRGASIWEILPWDAAGQERLLVEEAISSGHPVSFMDKFGDRWLESSVHPFLDGEGRVEKLAVFRTDITNRRRTGAEQEAYREELERTVERRTRRLRDLNKALQTTSECNQILFRAQDEMGLLGSICRAIVDVQGAGMAWVGFIEDGGRSVRPVAQAGLNEDYVDLIRIAQETDDAGEPAGTAIRTRMPCVVDDLRKDAGPVIWRREARRRGFASTASIPLLAGDEVMGVLNIFSDDAGAFDDDRVRLLAGLADDLSFGIRTLRARAEHRRAEEALARSEARYRELVANLSDMVVEIGLDGTIAYASPQVERIFGFRPEELVGKSMGDFIHPDYAGNGLVAMTEIARDGLAMDFEFKTLHKDGRYIDASISGRLVDASGTPKIVGIVKDITGRKQDEARLRAALREKEVLLKEVHHRVKNNLQVIISLLSIQSRQVKDRAVLDVLRDSESRIRSIALIHEKLCKSQDVAMVDFAGYVQNLVPELFKAYALEKGAPALDMRVQDLRLGIDIAVPCGLIINELVTNCLKHAFPSGRNGTITVDFHGNGNGRAALMVGDDGIGMPPGIDLHDTQSIGLGMVKALCEQLEGTLEMERGRGTAITVSFSTRPEEG